MFRGDRLDQLAAVLSHRAGGHGAGRVDDPQADSPLRTELIEALNQELLTAAAQRGEVHVERVRADTTVVEADIKYPTDSGLLTAAVGRIAVRLRRLRAAGAKVSFTDRTSEARAHQHSIGVWLRRRSDEAKAEVLVITGRLADLATATVIEATKALQHEARRRQVRRLLDDLAVLIERTERVIDQVRCRVGGEQPAGATRLVSLHEPDARPIRKGRLGKPVEFGYKAQVVDNPDGLILDYSVHIGNPSDTDLLRPAIDRITTLIGMTPVTVTADRGYWNSTMESDLAAAGVPPSSSHAPASPQRRGPASSTPTTSSTPSNGAPDPKDASHTSNATADGAAPACAATPAPAPGAPTASSPTTSSNSSNCSDEPADSSSSASRADQSDAARSEHTPSDAADAALQKQRANDDSNSISPATGLLLPEEVASEHDRSDRSGTDHRRWGLAGQRSTHVRGKLDEPTRLGLGGVDDDAERPQTQQWLAASVGAGLARFVHRGAG